MQQQHIEQTLMTVADVAEMMRMSTAWVRQHSSGRLRQPTIPSVKMGKSVRFRRPSVEEFIRTMERSS